jgi:hypothetical protein
MGILVVGSMNAKNHTMEWLPIELRISIRSQLWYASINEAGSKLELYWALASCTK